MENLFKKKTDNWDTVHCLFSFVNLKKKCSCQQMRRPVGAAVVFLPLEDVVTPLLHIPQKPLIPVSQYLNPANPVSCANRNEYANTRSNPDNCEYLKHFLQLYKKNAQNNKTTKIHTNHFALFCWTFWEQGII